MSIFILFFTFFSLIQIQHCSVRLKRVIGGQPDDSSDHGFLAALIGKKGYSWDILNIWGEYRKIYCSGALINNQWIVTAAHCFTVLKEMEEENNYLNDKPGNSDEEGDGEDDEYDIVEGVQNKNKKRTKPSGLREIIDFTDPSLWKVRLAVRNLKPTLKEKFLNFLDKFLNKSSIDIYYHISKIIRHPLYTPWNLENDVAVLKLSSKLNISCGIRTIPLTNSNTSDVLWPPIGKKCKVIGWGCKEYDGPIMNRPHSVNLPILNPEYCRKVYRTDINLTDHQEFCAGYYDQNIGICAGDSGGPLVCMENGKSVLSGVVSATHIDDPNKYPGIFARISFFRNWINDVMKKN